MGRFIKTGEGFRARQADKRPVHGIGPCVIGADHTGRAHGLLTLNKSGAPVATDVEEDVRLAIFVPRNEQGTPKAFMRHRHVGFRHQC